MSQSPTPPPRQTFKELDNKSDEARSKFQEITECTYTNKSIGSSGQQENMTCDCSEHWDSKSNINKACDEDSQCINRLTSVECVNGDCGCGDDCQNQRFQKKQFANVSVIQTEKKGYGLRADSVITESSFVYEYIGEVIDETTFRRRMIDYDTKNFKHFYFMMLKNDSFIDATIKGSFARFCNHSCNPNSYVDKWVVGDKLRMGIFAKRDIEIGEEITFDYNVDRYGAQSQPCYCGEPNCIKFMGGKTQTDAALLLPDGISEALGVSPKHEKQWLKENKHLRSKQQSEDAIINQKFVADLEVTLLTEPDVSKVMGALMKLQDLYIVKKLVDRIYMTDEESVNVQIIRLHGYKALSTLIKEFQSESDLIDKILIVLGKWPKVTRNKISSSQIENVIRNLQTDSEKTKELCAGLLEEWGKLQMAYRIPKTKGEFAYGRRSPTEQNLPAVEEKPLPNGWEVAFDEKTQNNYYFHRELNLTRWDRPVNSVPTGPREKEKVERHEKSERGGGDRANEAILARKEEDRLRLEKQELFTKRQERELELQKLIQQSGERVQQNTKQNTKQTSKVPVKSKKHKDIPTEEKWKAVLAKHVPNLIKKHEKEIGRDNIKGCAKDLVKILVAKELKKGGVPAELDSHKLKKVGKFCDEFMEKFLEKYRIKKVEKKKGEKRKRDDDVTSRKEIKTE